MWQILYERRAVYTTSVREWRIKVSFHSWVCITGGSETAFTSLMRSLYLGIFLKLGLSIPILCLLRGILCARSTIAGFNALVLLRLASQKGKHTAYNCTLG